MTADEVPGPPVAITIVVADPELVKEPETEPDAFEEALRNAPPPPTAEELFQYWHEYLFAPDYWEKDRWGPPVSADMKHVMMLAKELALGDGDLPRHRREMVYINMLLLLSERDHLRAEEQLSDHVDSYRHEVDGA